MVGACTSAENRADLGTKLLPVHRLRQLRQWNGMVLDPDENSVTGDKEELDKMKSAQVQLVDEMSIQKFRENHENIQLPNCSKCKNR